MKLLCICLIENVGHADDVMYIDNRKVKQLDNFERTNSYALNFNKLKGSVEEFIFA